jgi:ribose/xylose/arabinose/galactoside ABC-type transport system permease subunit
MVEKNLLSKNNKHLNFQVIIPFLSLFIVLVIFGVLIPERFANTKNMILIIQQSIITMTVGFGMTFVIIGGGIDLSVGSVLALSGMIGATIAVSLNPILGLFVSILVGLVCGLINGVTFSFLRIPSFIVTLGMLQMARGFTTIYSKGFPVMMPREILWMGSWPGIFVIASISFIIVSVLFNFTKIGEFDRAIGGNETVAEMSGVPVKKYKVIPFIISGCFAGLGGFIMAARLGVASPTIGTGYELDVIASVVLGGTPLTGGVGNVYGTIIGAIIMSTIGNGLVIMGVPSQWQLVVKGIILIGAVFISIDRGKIGKIK